MLDPNEINYFLNKDNYELHALDATEILEIIHLELNPRIQALSATR
jgi:hypothetical protein